MDPTHKESIGEKNEKNTIMFIKYPSRGQEQELCGIAPALWNKVDLTIPHLLDLLRG